MNKVKDGRKRREFNRILEPNKTCLETKIEGLEKEHFTDLLYYIRK